MERDGSDVREAERKARVSAYRKVAKWVRRDAMSEILAWMRKDAPEGYHVTADERAAVEGALVKVARECERHARKEQRDD